MDLESRCLTLDERLSPNYIPLSPSRPDASLEAMRLWAETAAGNHREIFAKRLARDGLSDAFIVERLGAVRRAPNGAKPLWLEDAEAVIGELSERCPDLGDDEASNIPFGPCLQPLVQSATAIVARQPAWTNILSSAARASARRQLWQSLSELFAMPIYQMLIQWRRESRHRRAFTDFVAFLRRDGFQFLFERYPVLARAAGTVRRQWLVNYGRFLQRLEADASVLAAHFGSGMPLVIEEIRYGLSDPHGAGETVLEARLPSGKSLFYKPRSLQTDTVAAEFAAMLQALDSSIALVVPRFLDRGNYGWVEGIVADGCHHQEEIERYFWRAGAWLGCFHLLNASDMHMENIIASADNPIPVDFETLFQAMSTRPKGLSGAAEAHWRAATTLEESVLAVGLLPGYVRAEDGVAIRVGGLEESEFEIKRLTWSGINTTDMSATVTRQQVLVRSNLPRLNGNVVSMDAYRTQIMGGLRQVLTLAAQHKDKLAAVLSKVRRAKLAIRRVLRPTRFYYLLLRRMSDHRTMTDGVRWSLQTELIARLYDWEEESSEPWKLFKEERAALCRFTIPAFYLDADGTVARAHADPITNLHARDGLSVALTRIESMNEEKIETQCAFTSAALGFAGEAAPNQASVTTNEFVGDIVAHISHRAISADASAAWLGLEYLDHRLMSQVVPIGYDLYNGNLGIGLFLAIAARYECNNAARDLSRRALAPIKDALRSSNRHRLQRALGIGGYLGLGSLVYGLATYAQIMPEDDEALTSAMLAARLIDDKLVQDDTRHDLVSGAAGAILALLKLHSVGADDRILAQAGALGETLLSRRRANGAPWTSPAFENAALTGLSHGASGFALAFARLHAATTFAPFHKAAADCLSFERAHLDTSFGNWRDTRPAHMRSEGSPPNQWCYGAAGIGYARLAMLELSTASSYQHLEEDLRIAVASVSERFNHSNDTLCCGTAGHADFLAAASIALSNVELLNAAKTRVRDMEQHWRQRQDVRWDQGSKNFNIGLMRGLAGVGYAALRVRHTDAPRLLILS